MRNQRKATVRWAGLAVLLLWLFAAAPVCRAALILDVTSGSAVIGSLIAQVDAGGSELGGFILAPAYRGLLDDAAGREFRFFQVVYYDDEPSTWGGSLITAAGAAAHSGTVVDVPSGGWDYQLPGGDDASPFYESDTAANPVTLAPYAYPSLSYPVLHSADGSDPGYVLTHDLPSVLAANHLALFQTFLVYSDPLLAAAQRFDLVSGYAWGVGTNAGGTQYGISPTGVVITPALVAELNGALGQSGFGGWTAQYDPNFVPVPEPGMGWLVGLGLVGAVGRGLRLRLQRTV